MENIICVTMCVISTKLSFQKPMDRCLGTNIWEGESILKKSMGCSMCSCSGHTQEKLKSVLPFQNDAR